MEIPFELPELLSRRLAVRTGGVFSDPVLLVDGKPVPQGKDGNFSIVGEEGGKVILRLLGRGLDLVPDVLVESGATSRRVVIMPPLRWYEYAWCLLPLLMLIVVFRGPVSGLLGAFITYANLRVFRGIRSPLARFACTALVSAASIVAYYGVAYLLLSNFRAPRP